MKNKLELQDLKCKIDKIIFHQIGRKTTICLMVLNNGFEVLGSSACVSEDNFDKEIGETTAYEDAINKLWSLEGYLLQNELSSPKKEENSEEENRNERR